jgi:hypothetical protein
MSVDTYTRIIAFLLFFGWAAFTIPSLVRRRWRVGGNAVHWSELPLDRRANIIRTGGAILTFAAGAAFLPTGELGMVFGPAIMLPAVVVALWWGRVDLGSTLILRSERPFPFWMLVLVGVLLIAASFAVLILV